MGCRTVDVTDAVQGAQVPLWLLYPARAPERVERFGAYPLSVALDAAVEGERLPLVVISHGTGGSPWVYRDLAAHLARSGFVVALLAHPGNTRNDDGLAGTPANLENRPRHVRLVIDAAFADAVLGGRLALDGVGVIGHSLGGYTALAVAGGRPVALPNQTPDGRAHPVTVVPDARVRALVLLAPATPWLMGPGALADVALPILMFTGDQDPHAPPGYADIVVRGVPDPARIEHHIIANAGHFSFLSPFPPPMTRPDFPPSQDPPGFDRAAFLPVLCGEVRTFLRRELCASAAQRGSPSP